MFHQMAPGSGVLERVVKKIANVRCTQDAKDLEMQKLNYYCPEHK